MTTLHIAAPVFAFREWTSAMRLPNYQEAHVDRRKLTEYLLNQNHPDAEGKSAFFFGRCGDDWRQLREDLLEHATGSVVRTEETRHGTMYVIEEPTL